MWAAEMDCITVMEAVLMKPVLHRLYFNTRKQGQILHSAILERRCSLWIWDKIPGRFCLCPIWLTVLCFSCWSSRTFQPVQPQTHGADSVSSKPLNCALIMHRTIDAKCCCLQETHTALWSLMRPSELDQSFTIPTRSAAFLTFLQSGIFLLFPIREIHQNMLKASDDQITVFVKGHTMPEDRGMRLHSSKIKSSAPSDCRELSYKYGESNHRQRCSVPNLSLMKPRCHVWQGVSLPPHSFFLLCIMTAFLVTFWGWKTLTNFSSLFVRSFWCFRRYSHHSSMCLKVCCPHPHIHRNIKTPLFFCFIPASSSLQRWVQNHYFNQQSCSWISVTLSDATHTHTLALIACSPLAPLCALRLWSARHDQLRVTPTVSSAGFEWLLPRYCMCVSCHSFFFFCFTISTLFPRKALHNFNTADDHLLSSSCLDPLTLSGLYFIVVYTDMRKLMRLCTVSVKSILGCTRILFILTLRPRGSLVFNASVWSVNVSLNLAESQRCKSLIHVWRAMW